MPVRPVACSPASTSALLSWALATGSAYEIPRSAPPRTRSGGKMSSGRAASLRPSIWAPICRSGAASRRMGRRVSDASPSRTVSKGRPASRPVMSRIVVPELPQSSACAAARNPAKPAPTTRASAPAASTSMATPSARSACAVDRLSPPRPRPVMATGPSVNAPNSRARCEIDLSPGTAHVPRNGPEPRARSNGDGFAAGSAGVAGGCGGGDDGGCDIGLLLITDRPIVGWRRARESPPARTPPWRPGPPVDSRERPGAPARAGPAPRWLRRPGTG